MTNDDFAEYQAEMGQLRDRMLQALKQDQISRVEDGYRLYRRLLTDCINDARTLRGLDGQLVTDDDPSAFPNGYGREWDRIVNDLSDIATSVGRDTDTRAWLDFCEFVMGVALDSINIRALPAYRSYWMCSQVALRQRLSGDRAGRFVDDVDIMGLRLNNIELLILPSIPDGDSRVQFQIATSVAFVALIKSAVDADDDAAAELLSRYYLQVLEHVDWEVDEESTQFVLSSCIILLGWLLRRVDEEKRPDLPLIRQRLMTTLRGHETWSAFRAVANNELEPYFRTMFWEFDGPGPSRARMLTLGSYELLSAILTDIHPPRVEDADSGDVDLARTMQTEIDQGDQGAYSELFRTIDFDPTSTDSLRERLQVLVAADDRGRTDSLRKAPLDPRRIEEFTATLHEWFTRPTRLLNMLRRDDVTDESVDPKFLMIDRLVPKSYFVNQDAVLADPRSLAEQWGHAFDQGEEATVAASMLASIEPVRTGADELVENVRIALGQMPDLESVLILSNSFSALESLRASGLATTPALFRTHSEGPRFILLFDASVSLLVLQHGVKETIPGDVYQSDIRVLIGVSEHEAPHQVGAERSSANYPSSPAVRARVVERFRISIQEPTTIRYLELPDDLW